MRIRNLPYQKLNEKEKIVVRKHRKGQLEDKGSGCNINICKNSVEEFWEKHRDIDTNFGKFDGWIKPDELKEIIIEKLKKDGQIKKN